MASFRELARQARDRAAGTWNEIADDFNSRQPPPMPRRMPATHAADASMSNGSSSQASPQPLNNIFATVILNGSGNGVASIGPGRVREHWQISSVYVNVSTNNNEATCTVFVGSTLNSSTAFGTTFTGSTGDTCGIGIDIQPGMQVWAQWSGGDPGSQATVNLTGTYSIGAPQQ